jgi:hypothetical protein
VGGGAEDAIVLQLVAMDGCDVVTILRTVRMLFVVVVSSCHCQVHANKRLNIKMYSDPFRRPKDNGLLRLRGQI